MHKKESSGSNGVDVGKIERWVRTRPQWESGGGAGKVRKFCTGYLQKDWHIEVRQ